ncbi:MAG: urease subunit beta [Rhodospirillales bacterium]|nr:urease subunit beta [Rhodospirillales bacterium]MDE1883462.1 urease subunit beta [Rhodospirillales bacterium]MDE2390535.1 urease subunit beta [Rhodospirillales bacterium]
MNLSPTELERLIIFTAAEHARRLKARGVKLSHPEAVALIADEMLLAARCGMAYEEIVNMAATMLTAADVEPGVPTLAEFVAVEASFPEGTKLVIVFRPIADGQEDGEIPGEIIAADGEIELNAGRERVEIEVLNTGDRDIQVRSHAHFFETNPALQFDRRASFGFRLDVASGSGIRFEPGISRKVTLVAMAGDRIIHGQGGLTRGRLDDPEIRAKAFEAVRQRGYKGA